MQCFGCGLNSEKLYSDLYSYSKYCPICISSRSTGYNKYVQFTKKELAKNTAFRLIRSTRRFGIELEFNSVPGIVDLYNMGTRFGFKPDGTPTVFREAFSPPLSGDLGMLEVNKLCVVAAKNNWGTNNRCGFHLHIDMPEKDDLHKVILAYRYTQPLWYSWVNKSRIHNHFCKGDRNYFTVKNLKAKQYQVSTDRFFWMNYGAINRHGTVENRLHHGTKDWKAVKNWIKANLYLVDWALQSNHRQISVELSTTKLDKKFKGLSYIWNDRDLSRYYLQVSKANGVDLTKPQTVNQNANMSVV